MLFSKRSKFNGIKYKFTSKDHLKGIRFWNSDHGHYRKYIRAKGTYLSYVKQNKGVRDDLYFWGEWEAQSKFEVLKRGNVSQYPNAIHEPYLNIASIGIHNTDPYVFGARFYYSNCKQNNKKIDMKNLPNQSILLFGSEYDCGYALDTVFVIKSGVSSSEYLKSKENYPEKLRAITLDHNNLYKNDFTLYDSLMHDDNQSIFSYVPCALGEEGIRGVPRPLLDFNKFGLQKPGSRSVLKKIDCKDTEEYWTILSEEIIEQGYFLGIQIDEAQ